MKSLKGFFSNLQTFLSEEKRQKVVVFVGLLLLLAIFLWGLLPDEEEAGASVGADVTQTEVEAQEAYRTALEEQTKTLLQQIDGVGALSVMITLAHSFETVYQTQGSQTVEEAAEETQHQIVEEVVLSDEEALVRTNNAPKVLGVAVVCQGGDHAVVQKRIVDTLTALFDVSSLDVSVVSGM